MCNLICRILVMPAYDSPIIDGDTVVGLQPCYLLPISLHHPVPMLMHMTTIILEAQG